jgi:hypothetical protein
MLPTFMEAGASTGDNANSFAIKNRRSERLGLGDSSAESYGIVFCPTLDRSLSAPSVAYAVMPKYQVPEERFVAT